MGRNAGRGRGQGGDVLSLLRDAGSRNHPQGLSRPCGVAGSHVGASGGSWRPRWTVGRNTPTWPLHVAWAPARHGGEVRTEPGRSLLPRRTWPPKPRTVAATKITREECVGRAKWGCGPLRELRTLQTVPSTKASACTRAGRQRRDSLPEMVFPAVTWTGEQPRLSHTVTVSVSLARLSPPGGEFPEGGNRILHPLRASDAGTSALKTPRSRWQEGPSSRALGWQ